MPDPKVLTAIALAKSCGTYNQADRSAQYTDASLKGLLRSHNKQWAEFRRKQESDRLKIWVLGSALGGCWALVLTLLELLLKG